MLKILGIVITGIVTSMFLFPIQFVGLADINTKHILAGAGMIIFLVEIFRNKFPFVDKNFIVLCIYAFIVSFFGYLSITINATPDTAYAFYLGSMVLWLSSAYFTLKLMQVVHGRLTIRIICNYLICVCVMQCFSAILLDRNPEFKKFIDSHLSFGQEFIDELVGQKRIYGIGATLDVAGTRFSAVLIALAVMLKNAEKEGYRYWIPFYIFAFFIISFIGNMIARTTIVGVILVCIYALWQVTNLRFSGIDLHTAVTRWLIPIMAVGLCAAIYLYNTDDDFKGQIRFGFEGFFSLYEEGEWNVSSNDRLKGMYVWPDNTKTWLIGDGYFSNPTNTDDYFVGEVTGGYYKGSDAGYVRFIFYFGVLGLAAFCAFFLKAALICAGAFRRYRVMFLGMLLVNYIVWIKVATDIFIVFAPFLCLAFMRDEQRDEERLTDGEGALKLKESAG